jgi:hypothetical protein
MLLVAAESMGVKEASLEGRVDEYATLQRKLIVLNDRQPT